MHLLYEHRLKVGADQTKLKLNVCSREDSLYGTLNGLMENHVPITNLARLDKEIESLMLIGSERDSLKKRPEVLKFFSAMSNLLASSNFPSISIIKPLVPNVKDDAQVKQAILKDFSNTSKDGFD